VRGKVPGSWCIVLSGKSTQYSVLSKAIGGESECVLARAEEDITREKSDLPDKQAITGRWVGKGLIFPVIPMRR
jgi:hypothetical protein